MTTTSDTHKVLPQGIYAITAEKFSAGRSNIEVVKAMIAGGVSTIQYREKKHLKDVCVMLEECQEIRKLTREAGVLFIVNDHVDLAMLVDADGVHIGQEDLPVAAVRRLIGPDKIIGLSTHNPEQAKEAITLGADYIGVGPLFSTETKENVCDAVGLSYLEYVQGNIDLPFVAIGGIKRHNIDQVIQRGATCICLVTEIVGAPDIEARVQELNQAMIL